MSLNMNKRREMVTNRNIKRYLRVAVDRLDRVIKWRTILGIGHWELSPLNISA